MRYDVVFHPSWWNLKCGVDFSESFWNDAETRMEFDRQMRYELYKRFGKYSLGEENPKKRPILGSDMLACGYLTSQIMGCKILFKSDDAPTVLCSQLSEEEALAIIAPDFEKNGAWQNIQCQIDYLKKKYDNVISCIDFNGVQNLALDLRGQDLFLDYYDDNGVSEHLLKVCFETTLETSKLLKAQTILTSSGVSNITARVMPDVYLHSNCSVEMISLKNYEQHLLKYDDMLSEEFSIYGVHHCGQSMEHVIDGYSKIKNLRFVEVGAFSDLERVVSSINENVFVNARYSPAKLATVSSNELRQDIETMVNILPGKRLSISCVGIDSGVSDDRISEFCEYCKELL